MNSVHFQHRLGVFDKATPLALADTVDGMVNRAEATLLLLQGQFINEEGERLNDRIIFNALDAINAELLDIKAAVNAYLQAMRGGETQTDAN